jgi:multiple sugar transport system permease protein
MLLARPARFKRLIRGAVLLPFVIPTALSTLGWLWMFDSLYSVVNWTGIRLGVITPPGPNWLGQATYAMIAVIVVNVWRGLPFFAITTLAGLVAVPREYYEAAEVDGAGPIYRFRRITLPLLAPTTFFLLVISFIGAMQVFEQIYIMTNGGPPTENGGATSTIIFYIYQTAFKFFDMGYATALAYGLFAMLFVVTLFQFRFYMRTVEG